MLCVFLCIKECSSFCYLASFFKLFWSPFITITSEGDCWLLFLWLLIVICKLFTVIFVILFRGLSKYLFWFMWLVKVWDVETGRQLRIQQGHQAWVTDLLYSVAASLLFSCSLDGNVLVWSDKGKLLQVLSELWYVFFSWCYLKLLHCWFGLDIHAYSNDL